MPNLIVCPRVERPVRSVSIQLPVQWPPGDRPAQPSSVALCYSEEDAIPIGSRGVIDRSGGSPGARAARSGRKALAPGRLPVNNLPRKRERVNRGSMCESQEIYLIFLSKSPRFLIRRSSRGPSARSPRRSMGDSFIRCVKFRQIRGDGKNRSKGEIRPPAPLVRGVLGRSRAMGLQTGFARLTHIGYHVFAVRQRRESEEEKAVSRPVTRWSRPLRIPTRLRSIFRGVFMNRAVRHNPDPDLFIRIEGVSEWTEVSPQVFSTPRACVS